MFYTIAIVAGWSSGGGGGAHEGGPPPPHDLNQIKCMHMVITSA